MLVNASAPRKVARELTKVVRLCYNCMEGGRWDVEALLSGYVQEIPCPRCGQTTGVATARVVERVVIIDDAVGGVK